MRPGKKRDRLFARFEGLAVKAANDLWRAYSGQLRACSVDQEDVVQEARMLLLRCFDTIKPEHGGCSTWVYRTVHGRLMNRYVGGASRQPMANLGENSANLREKLPRTDDEPLYFIEGSDQVFVDLVLSGHTAGEAKAAMGWSEDEYLAAVGRIKRELEA